MTLYDYIVIGFYLLFMLGLGPVYKSFSKTASDYFRCGGGMLWWIVGSSAFMTTFYIRIVNPKASEERQIFVGRIFIAIYGLTWILVTWILTEYRDIKLFDLLLLLLAASVQIPITVPLFWGIFIKRTPPWAGWSTMLVGFMTSMGVSGWSMSSGTLAPAIPALPASSCRNMIPSDRPWLARFKPFCSGTIWLKAPIVAVS